MEMLILDPEFMADIVKRVLLRFLNLWKTQCFKLKKTSYDHIDVKMLREYRGYYSIQLTNCGYCEYNTCNISDLAQFVFRNFSVRKFLKNKPLAIINLKDEDVETTYDLYFPPKKRLLLIKNSHDSEKPVDFPFCKKYLSIKPMYRLMASDIEKFKATVLEEITRLCEENTNVKFTYRCDGKMLHNNYVPLDEEYKLCQVLSTTLTDIVRQSLDTEFREKCFAFSKAKNSGQLRDSLMTRLLPIINENYIFSTK